MHAVCALSSPALCGLCGLCGWSLFLFIHSLNYFFLKPPLPSSPPILPSALEREPWWSQYWGLGSMGGPSIPVYCVRGLRVQTPASQGPMRQLTPTPYSPHSYIAYQETGTTPLQIKICFFCKIFFSFLFLGAEKRSKFDHQIVLQHYTDTIFSFGVMVKVLNDGTNSAVILAPFEASNL